MSEPLAWRSEIEEKIKCEDYVVILYVVMWWKGGEDVLACFLILHILHQRKGDGWIPSLRHDDAAVYWYGITWLCVFCNFIFNVHVNYIICLYIIYSYIYIYLHLFYVSLHGVVLPLESLSLSCLSQSYKLRLLGAWMTLLDLGGFWMATTPLFPRGRSFFCSYCIKRVRARDGCNSIKHAM